MEGLREKLLEISDFFYQENVSEGMENFMNIVEKLVRITGVSQWINPLFDAFEAEDYILAADIMTHELANKMQN